MGLFTKLFGSDEDRALSKLRQELKSSRKVTLDYGIYAREVLSEKRTKGLLPDLESEVLKELIRDWEERLKTIVGANTLEELERLGKTEDFNRILETDIDPDAYLTHAIPNYKNFLIKAVAEAKKRL